MRARAFTENAIAHPKCDTCAHSDARIMPGETWILPPPLENEEVFPFVCPCLMGRRQSAAFKSGRGSEAGGEALLGQRLETEVYSKFEYYIGPEGAYGGVPPSCPDPGGRSAPGSRQEAVTPKPCFLLGTSVKLPKRPSVSPRREHR